MLGCAGRSAGVSSVALRAGGTVLPLTGSRTGASGVAGTTAAEVDMAAINATIRIIRDIALPFYFFCARTQVSYK
jgi:hypothetical protein